MSWCLVVLHKQTIFDKIVFGYLHFVACSNLHVLVKVLYLKVEIWGRTEGEYFIFLCALETPSSATSTLCWFLGITVVGEEVRASLMGPWDRFGWWRG